MKPMRKGSIGGMGGQQRGDPKQRAVSPVPEDTAYTSAVAVLNEATMSQACELLLSERDYESTDHGEDYESDRQKLLQLFTKCEAACKVIQQRAPAVLLPSLPQQARGPPPAARAQAKPLKPKVKATMQPPRRGPLLASSRGPIKSGSSIQPAGSSMPQPPPPRKLKRDTSDSSFASSSSVSSVRSAKKAHVSPPPPDASTAVGAPPPEAMAFLASLNAQQRQKKGGNKHEKKERKLEKKEAEPKETPTKPRSKSPPTAAVGNRKQPPRSARKE